MGKTYEALLRSRTEKAQAPSQEQRRRPMEGRQTTPSILHRAELLDPFAQVENRILSLYGDHGAPSVLFSGLKAGDGVSTCAAALALTLVRNSPREVLFLGLDPLQPLPLLQSGRDGTPVAVLGIPAQTIHLSAPAKGCLHAAVWSSILPSSDAGGGMAGLATLLEKAKHAGMAVVVDTPPLDHQPEALLIAPHVDAVVMVFRAGKTRRRDFVRVVHQLRENKGHILGFILNRHQTYVPDWLTRRLD